MSREVEAVLPKFVPMSVEYLDHMGSDVNVVNSARVSYAKEVESFDKDKDAKLINYLAKYDHWSPFAHTSVSLRIKAPIFVARQLVKHYVGACLSEDTEIDFVKKTNGVSNGVNRKTLKHLADMWFGRVKYQGGKKGKMNVTCGNVRVFNEVTQRFEESKIVNVIDSGRKDVYLVTDNYGNSIKATGDHKFLTDSGWKRVDELCLNDKLIRHDMGEPFAYKELRSWDSDDVIIRREHRKTINDVDICRNCGGSFDKHFLIADHIIPVSQGGRHEKDNMQTLCTDCHKDKTAREMSQFTNDPLLPKYVRIESIEYAGKEQCYDLSIERIHNFMGNGFVVHNCWNEESRRYISNTPEFYKPDVWRNKPKNSKQGSEGEHPNSALWDGMIVQKTSAILEEYERMIQEGVAPEQARMILPQNTMTNWIWTGSVAFFARVCKQRLASDAQKESQEVAQKIQEVVAPLFPYSWEALMKWGR